MGLIPYPQMPLHSIRITDMCMLMAIGAIWEFIIRSIKLFLKRKPIEIRKREVALKNLDREVNLMRAKGPSAFVATSKLERQQLAENKALAAEAEQRKSRVEYLEKITRRIDMTLCIAIFFLWYGIPILEFSAHRVLDNASGRKVLSMEDGEKAAADAFRSMLFPLSYVGVGLRVSRWGLPKPGSSMGALLAYWAAQTTVSQLMDCVDALFE